MRQLKHHEQKLLKKVNFFQWKSENNLREIKVLRRYHVQDRDDYLKYNKVAGLITKLTAMLKDLPNDVSPRGAPSCSTPDNEHVSSHMQELLMCCSSLTTSLNVAGRSEDQDYRLSHRKAFQHGTRSDQKEFGSVWKTGCVSFLPAQASRGAGSTKILWDFEGSCHLCGAGTYQDRWETQAITRRMHDLRVNSTPDPPCFGRMLNAFQSIRLNSIVSLLNMRRLLLASFRHDVAVTTNFVLDRPFWTDGCQISNWSYGATSLLFFFVKMPPTHFLLNHVSDFVGTRVHLLRVFWSWAGPEVVTDPAFHVTRNMEDFITWVDSSKIRRKVMKYNDAVDDYDLLQAWAVSCLLEKERALLYLLVMFYFSVCDVEVMI
jgi:hypothetical protein